MSTMPARVEDATQSDAALVILLESADELAFSEIYDRYAGFLYGMALRVCKNAPKAEEIVQDTLMKLWRNPRGFDPTRGALSTFLLTLTRNAAIDALRRDHNPTLSLTDDDGEMLPIPSAEFGPLERAELEAVSVRVQTALLKPSNAHRRTVELAYFHGSSREEIALEMNVPVGTVKSRLKYALDKLRGTLGELAGDA